MAKPLVIVESPAKAKTLSRFLGGKFRVEASIGHVRDLPERASEVPKEIKDKPWGRMAVDVDGDFTPYYVVPLSKRKRISELKAAVKEASEVLLATDPDREGESISAHLQEVLQPKVPTRRIVFHEITEEAVREAIANARDVDHHLVKAQEGRRILDRLFGYTLSPVLWKKVGTGLSAGRVQSVAVRLIVEREEERRAFHKASFWDLEARIAAEGREFTATLVRLGDRRIASGKDFDAATGKLKESTARLLTEADAGALAAELRGRLPWAVTAVEERPQTQRPSPPFTTSTLQQEANRKLGFSADRTMKAAQGLHDEGLISYHRTDSTTLSQKALGEAAKAIKDIYGAEFHTGTRQYQTKVRNAQEAHEAIRPTDFDRRPQQMSGLDADEARIYELIWKRAIASQMADARLLRTSVEITAPSGQGDAVFTASGKAIQFAGFLRAYVEGSDDPAAALDDQETILPTLSRGQPIGAEGAGRRDARAARLEGARDHAAGALHRRLAGEAPRGRGHRPAVDLRVDHQDDPRPRLRVPARQGAGPELHRVRGHRPAAVALLRLRRPRVHRGDGGGPRPDRQRRADVVRLRPRVLPRHERAAPASSSGPSPTTRSRIPPSTSAPTRRRTCRSASASAASARSWRAAKAATATPRRCPTRSRRPTSPSTRRSSSSTPRPKGRARSASTRRRARRSTC